MARRPGGALVFDIHGFGTRLYGSRNPESLPAYEAMEAESQGWCPYTYQAVRWFTLLYVPVVPLGTYRVMRCKQPFWTLRQARYRGRRMPSDWSQVIQHY